MCLGPIRIGWFMLRYKTQQLNLARRHEMSKSTKQPILLDIEWKLDVCLYILSPHSTPKSRWLLFEIWFLNLEKKGWEFLKILEDYSYRVDIAFGKDEFEFESHDGTKLLLEHTQSCCSRVLEVFFDPSQVFLSHHMSCAHVVGVLKESDSHLNFSLV